MRWRAVHRCLIGAALAAPSLSEGTKREHNRPVFALTASVARLVQGSGARCVGIGIRRDARLDGGMEYSIRRYTPDLRDQVVELLTHLWSPQVDVNDRGFRWKYERNPYLADTLVYVAMLGGRVVAMRGAYGARWIAGREARPLSALCVGDMVTHPEHRGRGLYRRIDETMRSELGAAGWEYLFNTSPSRAARQVLMTAGWSTTPFIRPYERGSENARAVYRLRRGLSHALSRLTSKRRPAEERAGAHPLLDLRARVVDGVLERAGEHVVSISDEPSADIFTALSARVGSGDTVRHVKDAQYFTWRFGNPLCRYLYVHHRTSGREDGFAVLHAHTDRQDAVVNVIDWEVADPGVLERLLRVVTRALPDASVSIWPDPSSQGAEAAIRRAGFAPIPDPPPQWTLPSFVLFSLGARSDRDPWTVGGASLLAWESWSLRMVASDFY